MSGAADGRGATSWRLGIPPASPHDEHRGGAFGATDSSAKRTRTRRYDQALVEGRAALHIRWLCINWERSPFEHLGQVTSDLL